MEDQSKYRGCVTCAFYTDGLHPDCDHKKAPVYKQIYFLKDIQCPGWLYKFGKLISIPVLRWRAK